MADAALLRALEERLLDAAVRADRDEVSRLLADDFMEIGASGRVFDRARVIEGLAGEVPVRRSVEGFAVRALALDVALVTYRVVRHEPGDVAVSFRSSVWKRIDGRWQIMFHQGTPAGR